MLNYYNNVVNTFDSFIGLSFNTNKSIDKNVSTKFFIKANSNGAGAAYYGIDHTAQNADTISGYLQKGLMSLHEFGHGYEGILARSELTLVEVINNILAYYYQNTFLKSGDLGWLWAGGRGNVEPKIVNAIENVSKFNNLVNVTDAAVSDFGFKARLYVFVNLLDKIGAESSMAAAHSLTREYKNNDKDVVAADIFAISFSNSSLYNVISYLEANKIVSKESVFSNDLPMIYSLKKLVSSDESALAIKNSLGMNSIYSVVSNSQLSDLNIKGNLNLTLSTDNIDSLRSQKVIIKDGDNVIKEVQINEDSINVADIPIGVYSIIISNASIDKPEYVVITENGTTKKSINVSIDSDKEETIIVKVPSTNGSMNLLYMGLVLIFIGFSVSIFYYIKRA